MDPDINGLLDDLIAYLPPHDPAAPYRPATAVIDLIRVQVGKLEARLEKLETENERLQHMVPGGQR